MLRNITVIKIFALLLFVGCKPSPKVESVAMVKTGVQGLLTAKDTLLDLDLGLEKLSDYGFFKKPLKELLPSSERVISYEMNSPLFSDYASKKRFAALPENTKIGYRKDGILDFPNGTILIKNFYYPASELGDTSEGKIIETRLLLKDSLSGEWAALPYIWNEGQTEAFLYILGKDLKVTLNEKEGEKSFVYSVPNVNMCKNCHVKGRSLKPLGPTARQINKHNTLYATNQFEHLIDHDLIEGVTINKTIPKFPDYADGTSGSLEERARAYLDVNCAHCHREGGSAKTSGLHLNYDETDEYRLGVNKPPVAAGRGSGNLSFDIVKGHPEESILLYRMKSLEADVMMPETGKNSLHIEGIALIENWIASLE